MAARSAGHDFHPSRRLSLAILIAVSVSGCFDRLAHKHDFFASASGTSATIGLETERFVGYHAALQAARRGCSKRGPIGVSPSADSSGTPLQAERAEDAFADLCGTSKGTHAAHGAPFNGYRRWVEDQVRELPEPSDTASSVGGDS